MSAPYLYRRLHDTTIRIFADTQNDLHKVPATCIPYPLWQLLDCCWLPCERFIQSLYLPPSPLLPPLLENEMIEEEKKHRQTQLSRSPVIQFKPIN